MKRGAFLAYPLYMTKAFILLCLLQDSERLHDRRGIGKTPRYKKYSPQSLKLAWIYVAIFLGILESTWIFLLTKI